MAKINGIEVSGEVYDIEDALAQETATQAKTAVDEVTETVGTLSTSVEETKSTVDEVSEVAEQNQTNIGTLDDLETTEKTSLVGAINEVKSDIPSNIPASLFDFLELLVGSPNASAVLGQSAGENTFYFQIPDYAKYKGLAFVRKDSSYRANSGLSSAQTRKIEFVLKNADNTCNWEFREFIGGDRLVACYQTIRCSASGQLEIMPGYMPKTDSDSDSDTSQGIFGVYAVYGIL